jgi:hypothetical protein
MFAWMGRWAWALRTWWTPPVHLSDAWLREQLRQRR